MWVFGIARSALLLAFLLCLSAGAAAHHSVAAFFERGTISELEGTVAGVTWKNPHMSVVLLVDGDDGQQEWVLEGGAVNSLERRGVTPDTIRPGDEVRVAGWRSRGGRRGMYVTNLLLPGGQELMLAGVPQPLRWTETWSAPEPAASAAEAGEPAGIFRVWSVGESYRLRTPLSFTPAALRAREAWNPLTDDPVLDCIAPGMPNAILNPYPIEFVDEGGRIRILMEEWDARRTIWMTSEQTRPAGSAGPLGYSVGRWEGRTLVVETTRIDWPYLDGDGTPQSDEMKTVERFTLSRDENRLDYEITVTDPENLVEPGIYDGTWVWIPGVQIKTYGCRLE